MNTKITTIIPFYNSGNDLSIMLESILNGTVMPTEILLIDDGSSDNSVDIAKDYCSRFSFIKYVKQNHAGVSAARNLGIQMATSDWISFLDADDYIESNAYELMTSTIENAHAEDLDLAGCVYGYFTECDGLSTPYVGEYQDIINSQTLLKGMFADDAIRGFLHTRLFKADIIKRYSFDSTIGMCEDLLFQTTMLTENTDLFFAFISHPLYHYVQNSNSATSNLNLFNGNIFKYKPAFDAIRKMVPESYVDESYNSILEYSMYRLLMAYKSGNKDVVPQIRLLQTELKAVSTGNESKRKTAYKYVPLLYSHFMK